MGSRDPGQAGDGSGADLSEMVSGWQVSGFAVTFANRLSLDTRLEKIKNTPCMHACQDPMLRFIKRMPVNCCGGPIPGTRLRNGAMSDWFR